MVRIPGSAPAQRQALNGECASVRLGWFKLQDRTRLIAVGKSATYFARYGFSLCLASDSESDVDCLGGAMRQWKEIQRWDDLWYEQSHFQLRILKNTYLL